MTRFVRGLKLSEIYFKEANSSTMTRFVRGLKQFCYNDNDGASSTMTRFVRGLKLKNPPLRANVVLL